MASNSKTADHRVKRIEILHLGVVGKHIYYMYYGTFNLVVLVSQVHLGVI